ncbi:hypothetical protein [Peribacillus sp. SCS-155]|uniref:hypothetical protein n=1 Tax=Peribacillus sedimenti TaxID=3115297 RepID=UPI003905D6CB
MTINITPCIVMGGSAKEAILFYERVLDATVVQFRTFGEMSMPCPGSLKESVAYSLLKIGENELMLFDSPINIPTGNTDGEGNPDNSSPQTVVTINMSITGEEMKTYSKAAISLPL